MSEQSTFEDSTAYYYICYREVRSDGPLTKSKVTDPDNVRSVRQLLDDILAKTDGKHRLADLDVESYFTQWISSSLSESRELGKREMSTEIEDILQYLSENFRKHMKTRAKAEGKYVVFIISEGSIIVCHSFTGKKAITTDMDVIEELLSVTNIDKYALFEEDDDELVVTHLDRNDTQSFSDWLGIPEEEIVFDVKGDIRVVTEIDDLECVVEFNEDDIADKLVGSDGYDLHRGMLITPNERERPIDRIQWGSQTFSDTETFKQEILTIHHKLYSLKRTYETKISNNLETFSGVTAIDGPSKTIKKHSDDTEVITKGVTDFEVLFVNGVVDMEVAWRKSMATALFDDTDPIAIFHAGAPFKETPINIGNLRLYNEVRLTDMQLDYAKDLLSTAHDLGTGNLRHLFSYVLFRLLEEWTRSPLSHFFEELATEFEGRCVESLTENSSIIQTEGESIGLEFKAEEWYAAKDGISAIAEGIHRELQNARLLVIGIDEGGKKMEVVSKNRAKSEHLEKIENALEMEYGMNEVHVWSFRIDGGYGLLALNVGVPHSTLQGDFTLLETI